MAAPPPPAMPTAVAPALPAPATLVLSTANAQARTAALACADALDNFHLEQARARCNEALGLDDGLALAHLWRAQAAITPEEASAELAKAVERAARSTPGERLYVDAWRAWRAARTSDARVAYDELVRLLPGEKRAHVARGQLRQVALGDSDGAIADYRRAIELDPRYAAAYNLLGFALADAGRFDEGISAVRKYAELAPSEPNAFDSLAALAFRRGDLQGALAEEKQALSLDQRFVIAHATIGDVQLLSGRPKEARKEYLLLQEAADPALHHEGAMRAARSFLFEDKNADAELAFIKEGDWARKNKRPMDAVDAFLEAARVQLERGALAEAGRGIREAAESIRPTKPGMTMPVLDELDRRRAFIQITEARSLVLAALQERTLAEGRVDEMAAQMRQVGDRQIEERAKALRGWIAYRTGDDAGATANLEKATQPTMRYAYALVLARTGEDARARALMEELGKRNANDLETALTRPRALNWLKAPRLAALVSAPGPPGSDLRGESPRPAAATTPATQSPLAPAAAPAPVAAPAPAAAPTPIIEGGRLIGISVPVPATSAAPPAPAAPSGPPGSDLRGESPRPAAAATPAPAPVASPAPAKPAARAKKPAAARPR